LHCKVKRGIDTNDTFTTKPDEGLPMSTPQTVTIDAARDALGTLANRIAYGREEIVVTRHGRPVLKMVPINGHTALIRKSTARHPIRDLHPIQPADVAGADQENAVK
jgi:antitoxin (DNA-binding transcriptional repressor) of toxin-antitoxin stability system